mmetsp:Transcript_21227/g.74870  ORF Transcript_21227/g.74870 Transcript_21227/m.74870 type:complete len:414 (+) Transcript_21227:1232-2473(+)
MVVLARLAEQRQLARASRQRLPHVQHLHDKEILAHRQPQLDDCARRSVAARVGDGADHNLPHAQAVYLQSGWQTLVGDDCERHLGGKERSHHVAHVPRQHVQPRGSQLERNVAVLQALRVEHIVQHALHRARARDHNLQVLPHLRRHGGAVGLQEELDTRPHASERVPQLVRHRCHDAVVRGRRNDRREAHQLLATAALPKLGTRHRSQRGYEAREQADYPCRRLRRCVPAFGDRVLRCTHRRLPSSRRHVRHDLCERDGGRVVERRVLADQDRSRVVCDICHRAERGHVDASRVILEDAGREQSVQDAHANYTPHRPHRLVDRQDGHLEGNAHHQARRPGEQLRRRCGGSLLRDAPLDRRKALGQAPGVVGTGCGAAWVGVALADDEVVVLLVCQARRRHGRALERRRHDGS